MIREYSYNKVPVLLAEATLPPEVQTGITKHKGKQIIVFYGNDMM